MSTFSPLLKRGVCVGGVDRSDGYHRLCRFQSPIKAGRLCWFRFSRNGGATLIAFQSPIKAGRLCWLRDAHAPARSSDFQSPIKAGRLCWPAAPMLTGPSSARTFSPLLKRGVCVGVAGAASVHRTADRFQSPIKAGRLCWFALDVGAVHTQTAPFSPLLKRGVCVGFAQIAEHAAGLIDFQSPIKAGRLCWYRQLSDQQRYHRHFQSPIKAGRLCWRR